MKTMRIIPLILTLSLMLGAVVVSAEVSAPDTILYGDPDQNGTINAKDAMLVLQMYTGKVDSKFYPEDRCDVDNNGSTNAKDAMLILQKYTGKIEVFPVCHDWDDWKVEVKPTETETGIGYRFCKGCHLKETKELPVAESTEPAETVHEHEWELTDFIPAQGCIERKAVYTCTVCGETKQEGTGDKMDCKFEAVEVVPPTTEAQGYTVYKCVYCGTTVNRDYTDKLPASTEPAPTEPAPTEPAECTNHEIDPALLAEVHATDHVTGYTVKCKCAPDASYDGNTLDAAYAAHSAHAAECADDGRNHEVNYIVEWHQYDFPEIFQCIHCGYEYCFFPDYYDYKYTVTINP